MSLQCLVSRWKMEGIFQDTTFPGAVLMTHRHSTGQTMWQVAPCAPSGHHEGDPR